MGGRGRDSPKHHHGCCLSRSILQSFQKNPCILTLILSAEKNCKKITGRSRAVDNRHYVESDNISVYIYIYTTYSIILSRSTTPRFSFDHLHPSRCTWCNWSWTSLLLPPRSLIPQVTTVSSQRIAAKAQLLLAILVFSVQSKGHEDLVMACDGYWLSPFNVAAPNQL